MANRFRKVYIVCEDNQIFNCTTRTEIFRDLDSAEHYMRFLQNKRGEDQGKWFAGKSPKFKVHAFYLMHEDLFKS